MKHERDNEQNGNEKLLFKDIETLQGSDLFTARVGLRKTNRIDTFEEQQFLDLEYGPSITQSYLKKAGGLIKNVFIETSKVLNVDSVQLLKL